MEKVTFCKFETNFIYNLQTFHFGDFFECIFTFLSQIQVEFSSSLSWNLFVRLHHLSLRFLLSKMSRNETPSWLRLQNSE